MLVFLKLVAGELTSNIAIENNNGNTTPVAASSLIFFDLIKSSINHEVNTPVAVAANTTNGELISLLINNQLQSQIKRYAKSHQLTLTFFLKLRKDQ